MELSEKVDFGFIRYASLWEDADIVCQAVASVANRGKILCIASGGDNVLALLTLHPEQIVAADLSQAQLACLELKMAAFRHLPYKSLLCFLGVRHDTARLKTYDRLKNELSARSRLFWGRNLKLIQKGIIHGGKFERYLSAFGKWVLPLVHPRSIRDQLLSLPTLEAQKKFYAQRWNTWRYQLFFKLFFSRFVMGKAGRDPAFFNHVDGSVANRIFDRTRAALTQIPTQSNPYLRYILTGNYAENALPLYLRPENTAAISDRLDRIKLFHGPIDETTFGPYNAFVLSDIFEYMSPVEYRRCYERLIEQSLPHARLVYWNMLADRKRPTHLSHRVTQLKQLAAELHRQDKAWFYQEVHVDEVLK